MRECLREIAEHLSTLVDLFRVEHEMICVPQHFLEYALGFIQHLWIELACASESFDEPKCRKRECTAISLFQSGIDLPLFTAYTILAQRCVVAKDQIVGSETAPFWR